MNPSLKDDTASESTAKDRLLLLLQTPHESTTTNTAMQPSNLLIQESRANDESSLLLLNVERKCCRICLDYDDEGHDNDPMIAPCLCKGSSEWVHRSCLDRWRTNEPDRAFAQCTECRYTYHLVASHILDHPSSSSSAASAAFSGHAPPQLPYASSFWNQPRMKFCFFVSRDVCTITLLMQFLIASLGYVIMVLDQSQNWDLTHLILNPNSECNTSTTSSNSDATFWCRHNEAAVYYLFGIIALLVIVGVVGSIIFCRNGCSFHGDNVVDSNTYEQFGDTTLQKDATTTLSTKATPYHTSIPVTSISDVERGMKLPSDSGTSYQQPPILHPNFLRHRRRTTEFYRRQRHRSSRDYHNYCDTCGATSSGNANSRTSSSSTWSDRYATTNHFCIYTNSCPCDDPHTSCCDDCTDNSNDGSDDCCCCCCDCPGHHASSASTASMDAHHCNCGDGDSPVAIILFILLVFFVIVAIIGLFLLLVIGVIVCQRIVQRHIFLLQKQTLVQEFQVADLSSLHEKHISTGSHMNLNIDSTGTTISTAQLIPSSDTLHPSDVQRLQKLGLLNVKYSSTL